MSSFRGQGVCVVFGGGGGVGDVVVMACVRPVWQVNVLGTRNVIEACRRTGVPKIVMSSSPSTRFNWTDVDGLSEAELPKLPQKSYTAL